MTIREIMEGEKEMLTPADIAPLLGVHQQVINEQAKHKQLPFPYFRSGNRTKIPREGFLAWWNGKRQ